MGRASASGAKDVLINSLDLSGSILMGNSATESCCDAMQDAMKAGDILHIERTHSAGMTVRYLLSRESVALPPKQGKQYVTPPNTDQSRQN
jgi:hypothetical protein